jgi:FkbM family methyltransferase
MSGVGIGQRLRRAGRWLRVKWHLATRGAAVPFALRCHGYAVKLSLDEQIQRDIALGNFEPEESGWVEDFLKPGMVFVDVGANIGLYSLLAASRVGSRGRVVAFEPSPYCQDRLQATVKANAISQITIERTALGDAPGELELVVEHQGLHSPSFLAKEGDLRYRVPVTTFDAYLARSGLGHVDLMKIDVEGFEPNVIRGAAAALRQGAVGAILCELNEVWLGRNASSPDQLDGMIRSFGFLPARTRRYDYFRNVLYTRVP